MKLAALLALAACAHTTARSPAEVEVVGKTASIPPSVFLIPRSSGNIAVVGRNLYVASVGGVLISRDRGRTFHTWSAGRDLCVGRLFAAPSGGRVYAMAARCPEGDVQRHEEELYVSTDDGETWSRSVAPSILRGVDPKDPRILLGDCLFGVDGLCVTVDAGATWKHIPAHAGEITVAGDGTLLAGSSAGFERSTDQGATWHPLVAEPYEQIGTITADGAVLGWEPAGECALLRSTDGGPFTHVLGPLDCGASIRAAGRQACAVIADARVVASDDDGVTWRDVPLPPAHGLRYECLPDGDRVLVSGDEGLVAAPWPGR